MNGLTHHPSSRARRRELNRHFARLRDGFGNIVHETDPLMPKPMSLTYCQSCYKEKMTFDSETKALRFIEYNGERIARKNGHAPVRAYYCRSCGGWHVTSKEKRTRTAV